MRSPSRMPNVLNAYVQSKLENGLACIIALPTCVYILIFTHSKPQKLVASFISEVQKTVLFVYSVLVWKLAPLGTLGRQLRLQNVVSVSKRFSVTHKQTKQASEEQKYLGCLVMALKSIENKYPTQYSSLTGRGD